MAYSDTQTARLAEQVAIFEAWAVELRAAATIDPRYAHDVVAVEHRIAAFERRIARHRRATARRLWWGQLLYRWCRWLRLG